MSTCSGALLGGWLKLGLAASLTVLSFTLLLLIPRQSSSVPSGIAVFTTSWHAKTMMCAAAFLTSLAFISLPPTLTPVGAPASVCTASLVALGLSEPAFFTLALASARLGLPHPQTLPASNTTRTFTEECDAENAAKALHGSPDNACDEHQAKLQHETAHSYESVASRCLHAVRGEVPFALICTSFVAALHALFACHWAWAPTSNGTYGIPRAMLGWPLPSSRVQDGAKASPVLRACECPVAPLSCAVTALFGAAYAIACSKTFQMARANVVNWLSKHRLTAVQLALSSHQLLVAPLRAARALFFSGDSARAYALGLVDLGITLACFGTVLVLSAAAPLLSVRKAERVVMLIADSSPSGTSAAEVVLESSNAGKLLENGSRKPRLAHDVTIPDGLRTSGQSRGVTTPARAQSAGSQFNDRLSGSSGTAVGASHSAATRTNLLATPADSAV